MRFGQFSGINNVSDPSTLKPEELTEATNVDIDDRGRIKRRPGFTQVYSGVVHSLWGNDAQAFFVERSTAYTNALTSSVGSATFTRALDTALDPDDYSSVLANVPRFSADGWFGEPQRTNLLKYSRTLDQTPQWARIGTMTVTGDASGIDGVANAAYTVADADAGTTCFLAQGITVADDSSSYACTFFVGKDADTSRFPHFQLLFSGGTNAREAFTMNTSTGEVLRIATDDGSETVTQEGDFWKVVVLLDNNGTGNTSLALRAYPAVNTSLSLSFVASTTGSIVMDAAQIENNSYPTTHIITTTASATRSADDLTDNWPSWFTNDGKIRIKWTPSVDDQGTIWLAGNYSDSNNGVGILHDGTNIIARKRISGTNYDATKALNYVAGTTYDIEASFSSTMGVQITVDGVDGTGHANTDDFTAASTFGIGNDGNSANYQAGSIRDVNLEPLTNGTLKQLSVNGSTYTTSSLRIGVGENTMSYAEAAGDVYYANGSITGMIRNGESRPWGVKVPSAQPTLSSTAGGLPAGRYQVAITYVDDLGREGGARLGAFIELSSPGSIVCSGIPSSGEDTIESVRLYVTPTNGDMYYRAKTLSDGTSSAIIGAGTYTIPLVTQFLSEPPSGTIVRYASGRIAVADGSVIYLSEPLSYHLFNLRKSFFQFPSDVEMMAAVWDGLYISADKLYWLPMNEDAPLREVASYKAIPGTDVQIGGEEIGEGLVESHVLFMTEAGPCYGGPGGKFKNLTNTKVEYPEAVSGASIVRPNRGYTQFVSSVRSKDGDGNVYTSDRAEATVIRNGVVIP